MTPDEKKSLAQQLANNPVWKALLDEREASALDALVNETDTEKFLRLQERVKQIRALRSDLTELASTRERKGAPA